MNYDPLDTCPYDSVHRILRSRMQFHLTRCSKNFPCSKKKQCPFDARHVVNEMEYNYHIATCKGRESVWHYKIYDKDAPTLQKLVPIDTQPAMHSSENWDNDVEVASYNPLQHILERPVVRTLIGESKARRKKFIQDERLRISRLEEGYRKSESENEATGPIGNKSFQNSAKTKPNSDNAEQEDYKPLRRPKKFQSENLNTSNVSINGSMAKDKENLNTPNVSINGSMAKDNKKSTTQTTTVQHEEKLSSQVQSNNLPKQQNSIETKNHNPAPKVVPFKYVSPLNKTATRSIPVNPVIKEVEEENEDDEDEEDENEDEEYENEDEEDENEDEEDENEDEENENEDEDNDVVVEEIIDGVEDIPNADISIIEKLSKTVEELVIGDEGHKQKSESLDKKLQVLKQVQMEKNDKKLSRCAANFPNLK